MMMRRPEFLMMRRPAPPCATLRRPTKGGRSVPTILLALFSWAITSSSSTFGNYNKDLKRLLLGNFSRVLHRGIKGVVIIYGEGVGLINGEDKD